MILLPPYLDARNEKDDKDYRYVIWSAMDHIRV